MELVPSNLVEVLLTWSYTSGDDLTSVAGMGKDENPTDLLLTAANCPRFLSGPTADRQWNSFLVLLAP